MTVDCSRKIGLRKFAQGVFEIDQHDAGWCASQVEVNRLAEFTRHGRRGGRVLSHARWQELFSLKRIEDAGFVAPALFPSVTARYIVWKGP